jgi:citrate lyase subunit beta / citryl-CoA lyase
MTARARRSCLTVPGSSERMLAKARALPADEVVVDLEDAVPPAKKTSATRRRVAEALLAGEWNAPTVAVRVNAVKTAWFADDVDELVGSAGEAIDCLILPKVETADDVTAAADLLDRHGVSIGLETQIESPRGLLEVERIAASSARLEALVFGPGDYAASLGIPQLEIGAIDPGYPGDQWNYARSRIAVAACAYGLDAIDGPYARLHDPDGLRESARRARLLGFTGKWAIHPSQIAVCNEEFAPSEEELKRAEHLLAVLRDAEARGEGAATFDGRMIDEASRKMAEALIARRVR